MEEHLSFLRESYSEEKREEEYDEMKVFVAQRNGKGHLQNLGSFYMPYDSIESLEKWLKDTYGRGRYCVYLQRGSFRSRGVDIIIGTGKRRKPQKQDFGTIAGMPQFDSQKNLSLVPEKSDDNEKSPTQNPKSPNEERIAKWMTSLHTWWGFVKGTLRAEGLVVTYKDFLDARKKLKLELEQLPEEELKRVYNSHLLEAFEDHLRQICLQSSYFMDDNESVMLSDEDYSDEE